MQAASKKKKKKNYRSQSFHTSFGRYISVRKFIYFFIFFCSSSLFHFSNNFLRLSVSFRYAVMRSPDVCSAPIINRLLCWSEPPRFEQSFTFSIGYGSPDLVFWHGHGVCTGLLRMSCESCRRYWDSALPRSNFYARIFNKLLLNSWSQFFIFQNVLTIFMNFFSENSSSISINCNSSSAQPFWSISFQLYGDIIAIFLLNCFSIVFIYSVSTFYY